MSGNELPKVIDRSQEDIDAAIEAIKASDISAGAKDFAISCIKLAVWLPKALLEHKIKLSTLCASSFLVLPKEIRKNRAMILANRVLKVKRKIPA